jgi:hypothetical protein
MRLTRPRAALRCLLLAALAGAARGAFTCATTDNATTCAVLGQIYAATGGATTWLNRAGWSTAASGTPTSYCTFTGITGSNSQCVAGAATPHFTWLCVHTPPLRVQRLRDSGALMKRVLRLCRSMPAPAAQGAVPE